MRHERSHTKVVTTLGPACNSITVLSRMFEEGIDVCRLNFSHGSHEDHLKSIRMINELNTKFNSSVAILGDLQGPKLRIGDMENNAADLEEGKERGHADSRVAADEIDHPMMGPPQPEPDEDRVGLAGEVAVGEEQ